MAEQTIYHWGTGRRKSAVARVRIKAGTGKITINDRDLSDYFTGEGQRLAIRAPLESTASLSRFDILARCHGGGKTGQSGAVVLGIARALVSADPSTETALRDGGFLTRDSRMKERKKYGQKGARARFQFSKR